MQPSAGSVLHPLGQFVYLESLGQAREDRFHALLLEGMRLIVETERIRGQEHAANLRSHYESLDRHRADYMTAVLAATSAGAARDAPALTELTTTVRDLAEQVAELGEDPEMDPQTLAKLSENPNDLERALAAVQNIIGAVANSPIGAAIADRLKDASGAAPIGG
jgi:hypothetical protein